MIHLLLSKILFNSMYSTVFILAAQIGDEKMLNIIYINSTYVILVVLLLLLLVVVGGPFSPNEFSGETKRVFEGGQNPKN